MTASSHQALSILRGPPLTDEPGLGALTLGGFLREVTARYGEREALVLHGPAGAERWSYDELSTRATQVARALVACGVGKGDRVAILMTNRPEWLSATFGAALAGAIAAPLSTFSTPGELEQLLQSAGASVLLFERSVLKKDFADILVDLEPAIATAAPGALQSKRFPFLRRLAMLGEAHAAEAIEDWEGFLARGDAIAPEIVEARAANVYPSDIGVLMFSSGTTSKPKGILNAHRGPAIQFWRWPRMFALHGDVRCWAANGFFWSGNFGMAVGGVLACGGTIVLQRVFEPVEALDLMQAERVNFPLAWPHQWAQLEAASNWGDVDLSALTFVDHTVALARHPSVHSTWREPFAAYGNTETFTISTCFPSGTPMERIGESRGEALPGNIIKIVDPLTGETLPLGESGEIAVKGPTLMLGYVGATLDEVFDEDGFFRTGDGGHVDETGRLFWHGRLNDIIKTGGANVSPVEINEAIAQLPGVKMAQTVGVPHDTLGELVVACVVAHEGATLREQSMRDALKAQLASYKVPRRILFFDADELSLTGSAKIKTGDLRTLAQKRLATE